MSLNRPKILVISLDPVGMRMAGLGIRCTEIARALSGNADVTLAAPGGDPNFSNGIEVLSFEPHAPEALRAPIASADLVLTQPQWPLVTAWLRESKARIVFDLYAPETMETMELAKGRRRLVAEAMVNATLDRLSDAFSVGDHFICASSRQADMWLGAMVASRTLGIGLDRHLGPTRDLVDLVPFGITEAPTPIANGSIRAQFPSIAGEDKIVLWNGGLWPWLDANGAVEACGILSHRRDDVKLVFMGGSDSPVANESHASAVALSRSLGLLGSEVFFNERWVPYEERGEWLAEADCAISLQHDHLETRFAFRTRLLDCLWAGLPAVCSSGDEMSSMLAARGLASTVDSGDISAAADALDRELNAGRTERAHVFEDLRPSFTWSRAVEPIERWSSLGPAGISRRRPRRTLSHATRARTYRALRPLLARYQRLRPGMDGAGQARS